MPLFPLFLFVNTWLVKFTCTLLKYTSSKRSKTFPYAYCLPPLHSMGCRIERSNHAYIYLLPTIYCLLLTKNTHSLYEFWQRWLIARLAVLRLVCTSTYIGIFLFFCQNHTELCIEDGQWALDWAPSQTQSLDSCYIVWPGRMGS